MKPNALSSMKLATRLLIVLALPPTIMAINIWAHYRLNLRSELLVWPAFLVPTLAGATVLALAPWPTAPKILLMISYVAVMLLVVMVVGVAVSCSFGNCI